MKDSTELLVKVQDLSYEMNVPVVVEGRLPEKSSECAVEAKLLSAFDMKIGDTLPLSGPDDLSDQLQTLNLTIVGVVESPAYIGMDHGTSSLGDGKVDCFVLLPRDAFTMDYFTQINLHLDGARELRSHDEDYETLIETMSDRIEPIAQEQVEQRYLDIVAAAEEELNDAIAQIEDKEAVLQDEESKGRAELADARQELDEGWQEYQESEDQYTAEIADAEQKLADAAIELNDGWQMVLQNEATVSDKRTELRQQEQEAEDQFLAAEQELESQAQTLEEAKSQYAQGLQSMRLH